MNITDAFPNAVYTAGTTSVDIPLTDLPNLTAAKADAATGDIRAIMAEILRKVQAAYVVADPAPDSMTVTVSTPIGQATDQIQQSVTMSFDRTFDPTDLSFL